MTSSILSVSQLNRYIKAVLDEQKPLADLMVRGEIFDFVHNASSGHLYFTLRDDTALVRCVMFSDHADRLRALPQDGDSAVVRGAATLYERSGQYQIIAYDIQTIGAGAGAAGFEQLKAKLNAEGLFAPERKRRFPFLPDAVGVITSANGAALQDIIRTMALHNPMVKLIIYPAASQGAQAPASIIAALRAMQTDGRCRCAIIARGGGSADDLSVYNDEALVRAAAACSVPVVSAVGHEVDYTLLDYAADARAATPTAACAIVCAGAAEIESIFERGAARLRAASPSARLMLERERISGLSARMVSSMRRRLDMLAATGERYTKQLSLLNPAAVLKKGYSITMRGGEPITDISRVSAGDRITTHISGGEIISLVTDVFPGKGGI